MLAPWVDATQRGEDKGFEGGIVVVGKTERRQAGRRLGGENRGGGFFIHFYDHIDKVSSVPPLLGNTATLSWIEL